MNLKRLSNRRKYKNNVDAIRYTVDFSYGLNQEQLQERKTSGLVNTSQTRVGKSYWNIVYANVFSFFNVLLYIIAAAMIIVGYFGGLFFLVILFSNMFIGLYQDIRAKRMVEKLQLVTSPKAKVIREGKQTTIAVSEIVLDDIILLQNGDQVSADGIVMSGELSVNESLLTGESYTVKKSVGLQVLGGSYVTSGKAYVQVNRIGRDTFINQLQEKARAFKRPKSKLLGAINGLFKTIGAFVFLTGALMILSNIYQGIDVVTSVKAVSGSLVSMIPSGMYLLTSMTLAVAVFNLGKKRTLVQEMYAIEMLARTDVICIDKTGTITDGTMALDEIKIIDENFNKEKIKVLLGSFFYATKDESSTVQAIIDTCPLNETYKSISVIPFNSADKLSAVSFEGVGSFVVGAANFVLDKKEYAKISGLESEYMSRGLRVLLLAHSDEAIKGSRLPKKVFPVALLIIKDRIREDVSTTLEWFKNNGVQIKVISGDHPTTVGEICQSVGVLGAEDPVSLAGLSDEDVGMLAMTKTVFGRVTPEQKEVIVNKLKSDNKTVAMIGDGVNDILALKHADCSVAMASGSEATRHVAHMVLLDSNFNALPSVVQEGRRVINNLQRTWSLFLVKTIFTIALTLTFLIAAVVSPRTTQVSYPFSTQNMYVWEIATIGVAAFFLAMQPNYAKVKGTFMSNVILRAFPAAIVMILQVLAFFAMYAFEGVYHGTTDVVYKQTAVVMSFLTMDFFSFVILFRVCFPFNRYRVILFSTLFVLASGVVALSAYMRWNLFDVDFRYLETINIQQLFFINIGAIPVYLLLDFVFGRLARSRKYY